MSEWLAMGGHGVYVWSAYAVSVAALLGMGVWPWLALRRARGRIAATLGANDASSGASKGTRRGEACPRPHSEAEQPDSSQGGTA